jgi:hypothetical protein
MVLSGTWTRRAVGFVVPRRVLAIGRLGSRVAPGLGCKSMMFVGPAAKAVGWPMVGGVARRSGVVACRGAGLRAKRKSSLSSRPPWSALAGLGRGQGGRQGFFGGSSTVLQGTGMFRVLGELHLAPRPWLMGGVSAFAEHLSLSVPRTVIGFGEVCAGKMEGAPGRLEFSPRAA